MTSSPILSLVFALLCVLSIGVSATTLESSMQTDPDDVIDLDWDRVPIGEERAAEMKQEMQDNGEERDPGDGSEEEIERPSSRGEVEQRLRPDSGMQDAERAAGQIEQGRSNAQREASTFVRDPFPWDLRWLLATIGLLVGIVAVGYRYAGRFGSRASSTADDAEPPWPPEGRMTDVDRAWFAMVSRLDTERPWTRTPAEFAQAAVDAGLDPEGVEAVTAAFEDVRYGGSPVTEAQRQRARSGLRRLDIDPDRRLDLDSDRRLDLDSDRTFDLNSEGDLE